MYLHDRLSKANGSMISVRCRLFAQYAEIVGRDELTVKLPPEATVGDAVCKLREQAPHGELLPERPLVALNQVHALPDQPLQDGDELALLPPVAGG